MSITVEQQNKWGAAAVADGWTVEPGPWGNSNPERDHSIVLKKDDMVVWLVDRLVGPKNIHDVSMRGWFSNGRVGMHEVPTVYNPETLNAQRGACHFCGKSGDPARLKNISFAGKVCPDCDTKELRAELEPEGWYN